jgi:hypothetical protein
MSALEVYCIMLTHFCVMFHEIPIVKGEAEK